MIDQQSYRRCFAGSALLLLTLAGDAKSAPTIDFVANQSRLYRYEAGLIVDFATAGLAKFDLAYQTPWQQEETFATIKGGSANLTVPWSGGELDIVLVADSANAPGLQVNGKRASATAIEGGWRYSAGSHPAGELVLKWSAKTSTKFRSMQLVGKGQQLLTPCPQAKRSDQLPAARRVELLLEVAKQSKLEFVAEGSGRGKVVVTTDAGKTQAVWQGAGGERGAVDLAPFADSLVKLSFESESCLAWAGAKIAIDSIAPPKLPTVKNVILLVVDTLRADRLTVYGNRTIATPNITAAVSRNGVVMERNQSMAPSSPPSHATVQTGQIPRVHGVVGDKGEVASNAPVLAALAKQAGLFTGYVGNNEFAMSRFRKVGKWDEYHVPNKEMQGIDCSAVIARTLEMAKTAKDKSKRFFISALPIEPHVPYRYHKGITEKYYNGPFGPPFGKQVTGEHLDKFKSLDLGPNGMNQLRGLHNGEVEHFDGCFAVLEQGLAKLGLDRDTAIVLTSDHGEGLGERGGRVGHAYSLNHELVTVPFIVLAPGLAPTRVAAASSNADIAPTVLDLLGLPADSRMQGVSLAEPQAWKPRIVASEYGKAVALRSRDWHYVVDYDGKGKLFHIPSDSEETRDQSTSAAAALPLRYLREAHGFYLRHRVQWRGKSWGALNDFQPSSPLATGKNARHN